MTHRPIRTEADGTRVYADGHRYRPKPPEERAYAVRRPDDPRAVRWHGTWLLPLDLVDDEQRQMPETRPDTDAYEHMSRTVMCRCRVCRRPEAKHWIRKWQRDQGLRPPPLKKNRDDRVGSSAPSDI